MNYNQIFEYINKYFGFSNVNKIKRYKSEQKIQL